MIWFSRIWNFYQLIPIARFDCRPNTYNVVIRFPFSSSSLWHSRLGLNLNFEYKWEPVEYFMISSGSECMQCFPFHTIWKGAKLEACRFWVLPTMYVCSYFWCTTRKNPVRPFTNTYRKMYTYLLFYSIPTEDRWQLRKTLFNEKST